MKLIKIPEVNMSYPIGGGMRVNYRAFNKLCDHLFEHADEDLKRVEYVSLICRGSSGAIGATIFYGRILEAYPNLKDIRINHVKKEGESSHSGNHDGLYYYDRDKCLYILVDDFSNSGSTLYACYEAVEENVGLIDYVVLRYVYETVFERMKQSPITRCLITHVLT